MRIFGLQVLAENNGDAAIKAKKIGIGCVVAIVVLLGAWMWFGEPKPSGVSEAARDYLGNRTVVVLANAERVEVFRVAPQRQLKATQKIGDYAIVKRGMTRGKTLA